MSKVTPFRFVKQYKKPRLDSRSTGDHNKPNRLPYERHPTE